jgi:hypothetical protein
VLDELLGYSVGVGEELVGVWGILLWVSMYVTYPIKIIKTDSKPKSMVVFLDSLKDIFYPFS